MNAQVDERERPSTQPPVMVAGRAASLPLRHTKALSEQVVQHFVRSVAPCATLPREELHGDVTKVVRACIELVVSTLDGTHGHHELAYLRRASAQWAREGVPINTIHHAIHEGFKVTVQQHANTLANADSDVLREIGRRLIELMGSLNATVAEAYTAELRAVLGEQHSTRHTLVTALLGGRPTTTMARECGVTIAESYFVVALRIRAPRSAGPDGGPPRTDPRALVSLRRLLDDRCEGALSLLGAEQGTLLIPTEFGDDSLDDLVADLAGTTNAPLIATVIPSRTPLIPDTHRQAHELLNLALRSRRKPGLYRFTDLAVEYQLTRPGLAHKPLSALLNPLDDYPELLETLTVCIQFDFNNKRAARALHVHPNTIQHRFKRIADLVGFNPGSARGAWYLHSALLARGIANPSAPRLPVPAGNPGTRE